MNALSLCSGIGGIDLGLALAVDGYRTVAYCEIDPHCQDVLLARMAEGVLDRAPIWGDVRRLDGRAWRGCVDLVHGGYPCQPFSVAGRRRGARDPRHLWPAIRQVIIEVESEWVFLENVVGHLRLGGREVVRDLQGLGYRVAAGVFSAAEVGAPHLRKRLFLLAHAERGQLREQSGRGGWARRKGAALAREHGAKRDVAANPAGQDGVLSRGQAADAPAAASEWWAAEPALGRVVDGFPGRVDQLRALGNAVVPAVAALAWRTLRKEIEK